MPGFLLRHRVPRRACSLAVLALLCAVALVLLPAAILLDGLISTLIRLGTGRPGRRRVTRLACFAAAYLGAEATGLVRVPLLRRSDEDAHFALLDRLLARLFRTARRAFRLRVLPPEQGLELPDGPLLVLSRHAGPGDSFLLVYALLEVARRRPLVVLKRILTLDPLIDLVLGRTRSCFVGRGAPARAEATERIGELSASLGPRDALLLFPEGGNFTAARRERLLARLRRQRRWRLLPKAAALDHVLPAQPAGAFAAIEAAPPGTHVVFLAHTGLDRLESLADVWRAIPLADSVQLAWWAVPLAEIPAEEQAQLTWLDRHWARIDAWIDARATPVPEPVPEAAVEREPELEPELDLGSAPAVAPGESAPI